MPNTVTVAQVDAVFDRCRFEEVKLGEKTTVVLARLPNGFEMVETSSCVDPTNYDHALGVTACKRKVKDRIWYLLGFQLQCHIARNAEEPPAEFPQE